MENPPSLHSKPPPSSSTTSSPEHSRIRRQRRPRVADLLNAPACYRRDKPGDSTRRGRSRTRSVSPVTTSSSNKRNVKARQGARRRSRSRSPSRSRDDDDGLEGSEVAMWSGAVKRQKMGVAVKMATAADTHGRSGPLDGNTNTKTSEGRSSSRESSRSRSNRRRRYRRRSDYAAAAAESGVHSREDWLGDKLVVEGTMVEGEDEHDYDEDGDENGGQYDKAVPRAPGSHGAGRSKQAIDGTPGLEETGGGGSMRPRRDVGGGKKARR